MSVHVYMCVCISMYELCGLCAYKRVYINTIVHTYAHMNAHMYTHVFKSAALHKHKPK